MHANPTPRELQRMLFQGTSVPRPLLLPIVFSVGARIENVSLRSFLGNPTKITNAMRQLRGPLGADGITCYSDPFLEAEALGATLQWSDDDGPPQLRWPGQSHPGELPSGILSVEEAIKRGRIPIAMDVIRRLKALVRDELLLTAAITGPITLASRIAQFDAAQSSDAQEIAPAAMEIASAMVTKVASVLVGAGANVLFIREELLPRFTPQAGDEWGLSLAPAINIIRFYEALPALQLGNLPAIQDYGAYALGEFAGTVVCLPPDAWSSLGAEALAKVNPVSVGISISPEEIDRDVGDDPVIFAEGGASRRAIITTVDDVSRTAETRGLAKKLERVASRS